MCVVSMVMDHYYHDKWKRYHQDQWQPLDIPTPPTPPPITREEIEEFRRLLERARQYDREHGQPDCELDEKRRLLKDLADKLGIDISFIEPAPFVDGK